MIGSLEDIVAPLTEAEFWGLLRERKLTLLRGEDTHRFARLFDWNDLLQILERGLPRESLRASRNAKIIPDAFYVERNKPSARKLLGFLEQGASLVVYPLNAHAKLDGLIEDIRPKTTDQVTIGAIVTTGSGGALSMHYDSVDLLLLQVEGSKRWRVYEPTVANPVRDFPMPAPPQDGLMFDDVLRAGDALLLPAGYWHYCDNGPGRSLHLGISFEPLSGVHALRMLAQRLLAEERFRAPLDRASSPEERAARERSFKADLTERISRLSLADLLARSD